jgi:hypothetical protein
MSPLAPFQWLYILFIITGIAMGAWGIWGTIQLVRGTSDSYKVCLSALVTGVVVGGFHIYISRFCGANPCL